MFDSLEEMEKKLKSLLDRAEELKVEQEYIADEIENLTDMVTVIKNVLGKERQKQNEALATLITKRNQEGVVTDADFREYEKTTDVKSGFFDDPGEPADTEPEKDVA